MRIIRRFLALLLCLVTVFLSGCVGTQETGRDPGEMVKTGSMELFYAEQFAVDYYTGGYKLISIGGTDRFLLVPEGKKAPDNLDSDIQVLYQPVENIYLAASAAMCLFDAMDALDSIRLSGTKADGWHIDGARKAMEDGRILFAGKYSEPDYELLLEQGCGLAVENTMIGHASDVKEKLLELGIPVLTEHSSLEPHPLGRTEWIKLYGALLNRESEAEELFNRQKDLLMEVDKAEPTGKTVSFFYISSSGRVVARKSGDYVCQMISLAGGNYAFENLGDPETATSTVTIEMETFFAEAKDADILIYNSTIGGEISGIDQLLEKNSLLSEFKAVREGNVWCTSQNMYQQITELGQMIRSFHLVFSGEAEGLDEVPYLYRLR